MSVTIGRFTVNDVPDIWFMNMAQGRVLFSNPSRGVKNIPYSQVPRGAIIKKNAPRMLSSVKHATVLHAKPGQEYQHILSTRPINNMALEYRYKYNARTARNKARANALRPQQEANALRRTRSKELIHNLGSIDEDAYVRTDLARPSGISNETWAKATAMLANHKEQYATRKAAFAERQARFAASKKGGKRSTRKRSI